MPVVGEVRPWRLAMLLGAAVVPFALLMLVAVSGSLRSWLTGKSIHWRQIRRRNTVDVPVNATMVTASSRLDAPPASGMNSSGPVPTEVESGSASSRTGTNLLAPIRLDQDQPPKTDERN